MTFYQYVLATVLCISLAAGQILFKIASAQVTPNGDKLPMLRVLFTLPMMAACILYAATVVLYVYLLQRVPLSRAYLFSLGGSALVPAIAIVFFKESFSVQYALGASLVLLGIAISTTA